jgi:ubiquinone/menaquinone biosynthesis C-methylase UbiE
MNDRVVNPEWLQSSPPLVAKRNLQDLARINRWFGGHLSLLQVFKTLVHPSERFSVLDVGAASGDMGTRIREAYRNSFVVSLDHRMIHLNEAASPRLVADASALPFRERSFDFILCSLLLHHFSDCQATALIAQLLRFGRRALIVLELERHPISYAFLPLTKWLFRWTDLTVHDGCASVVAAFRVAELGNIVQRAGAGKPEVRKHRPWFRISAVLRIPGSRDDHH